MIVIEVLFFIFKIVFALIIFFWAKEIIKILIAVLGMCYTSTMDLLKAILSPITTRLSKSAVISPREFEELMHESHKNLKLLADILSEGARERLLTRDFPITRKGYSDMNNLVQRELEIVHENLNKQLEKEEREQRDGHGMLIEA
jgi:isopentenyl diphosphate isomerase/L-lactate dehydrogenase-like FMN-dependent dehydrogenase